MIDDYRPRLDREKLLRVNTFFNRIRYRRDIDLWGKQAYWATPEEVLVANGADCEDYAIAKYMTLRAMGIPEERLRLVYVKVLPRNQAHMVMAYFPGEGGAPLILDNLTGAIMEASQRADLRPVYEFNRLGVWVNEGHWSAKKVDMARFSWGTTDFLGFATSSN